LVGAFLFGKKGAVALAGISFIIDKINDFVKQTKIEAGIIDIENLNDVESRINTINKQLESQGKIITETIHLNNGVTHTYEEKIDLGEITLQQLEKEKRELETILFLANTETVNQFELNKHLKETTKEIEKQTKHHNRIINQFDAEAKLIERIKNEEKKRSDRLIGTSRNVFDEQQKLIFKTKEELSTRDKIVKKIKDQNEAFSLSNEIDLVA
jgi:hypothetical protein